HLRSNVDGKLITGANDALPSDIDTGSGLSTCNLEADRETGIQNKFSTGDPRVGDNFVLTALHALYLKNHNRICDWLKIHRTDLESDEDIFQRARAINIATFQQHVYGEYLPST